MRETQDMEWVSLDSTAQGVARASAGVSWGEAPPPKKHKKVTAATI